MLVAGVDVVLCVWLWRGVYGVLRTGCPQLAGVGSRGTVRDSTATRKALRGVADIYEDKYHFELVEYHDLVVNSILTTLLLVLLRLIFLLTS